MAAGAGRCKSFCSVVPSLGGASAPAQGGANLAGS